MQRFLPRGLGWRPDVPDFRDFFPNHPALQRLGMRVPATTGSLAGISRVDLREFFPWESADQGELNASPSFACVAMLEYFEYRAHGRFVAPSALFLDQASARLEAAGGISCGSLRSTFKTMARLGIPPDDNRLRAGTDELRMMSDPVLFSFAQDYRAIRYIRLDRRTSAPRDTLSAVKNSLAMGFPVAFGFAVPSSLSTEGRIDYRPTFDSILGGQAAVAVGFDDDRYTATRGALLIRCSWGPGWGEQGCGWLPYVFVEKGLALDFWTLIKPDWLASGEFRLP